MIHALTAPASSYSGQVVTRSALCVSGIPLLIGACITAWFILNAKYFGGK